MQSIVYTGNAQTGSPHISLTLPDGWTQVAQPGVLLAAKHDQGSAGFAPNLLADVVETPAGISVEEVAANFAHYAAQTPGAQLLFDRAAAAGDNQWRILAIVQDVAAASGVLTVVELVALTDCPGGPKPRVLRLVGSAAHDDARAADDLFCIIVSTRTAPAEGV
jgi:hypothetical protein